jgi:hypothetical protein
MRLVYEITDIKQSHCPGFFHSKCQTGKSVCGWAVASSGSAFLIRPSWHKTVIILWWYHHSLVLLIIFKWIILVCIMTDFNIKSDLPWKSVSSVSCFYSALFLLSGGASKIYIKLWEQFATWNVKSPQELFYIFNCLPIHLQEITCFHNTRGSPKLNLKIAIPNTVLDSTNLFNG